MDLKKVVKIKPEDERVNAGVYVSWGEEKDTPQFQISFAGKDNIKKARARSLRKIQNKRTRRFEDEIDLELLDKHLIDLCLVGWKGLKAKYLSQILDPTMTELDFNSIDPEVEVPYSEENKSVILEGYNGAFSRFISSVSLDVEAYQEAQREEQEGNSNSSPSG